MSTTTCSRAAGGVDHSATDLVVRAEPLTASLQLEWDSLARGVDAACFLAPGWILTWAQTFSTTPLSTLCARRGGELVGIVPFVDRSGWRSSPTNWHTPVFGILSRDRESCEALAGALVDSAPSVIDFCFLDSHDPGLHACLEAARARRRRVLVRTVLRSPYVDLSAGDWNAYRAALNPKLRKEIARLRRRLDELGRVSLEFSDGSDGLDDRLREGFSIEGSGWKDTRGTAITSDPRTERFYTDIAHWAAHEGKLMMAFLRLDGHPIAFDLCIEAGGRTHVLKGGFDPAFRRYGPGILLTYEALRRGFELGLRSYELLGDADRYKLAWTQSVRERARVQVFDVASLSGAVAWAAWTHGRPALRWLRGRRG